MILEYEYLRGFSKDIISEVGIRTIEIGDSGIIDESLIQGCVTNSEFINRKLITYIEILENSMLINLSPNPNSIIEYQFNKRIEMGCAIPNFRNDIISYYTYNKRKSIIDSI